MHALPSTLTPGAGRGRTALLVVPPFAGVDRPALGLHVLQASARQAGFDVTIFYANLFAAGLIGRELYEAISYAPTFWLLGERFFGKAAYGKPSLGADAFVRLTAREDVDYQIDGDALLTWSSQAERIADDLAALIANAGYPIVGFSTTFEQTAASIAMLNRLKTLAPDTIALVGGANCEGPMAAGILSLSPHIDYVFSGESESALLQFLEGVEAGRRPAHRIVTGYATQSLDTLPPPDYQDYYDQLRVCLPGLAESGDVWLPYECSRGCWWGVKHHCTFCGRNGQTMAHRTRVGDAVLEQLQSLLARHPSRKISMADNIMPYEYFDSLLPKLRPALGDVHIFFEQKANLSFAQVRLLKEAGVHVVQPGIESLSTRVLALIDKGVTARKNIELLRFARAADLALNWNHLIGLPGDRADDYWPIVDLIPALVHLNPPSGLFGLSVDRFSPYFERPDAYGITNLRPMASYVDVLPHESDVSGIAYHFTADYDSGSRDDLELQRSLRSAIDRWRSLWRQDACAARTLAVTPLDDDTYLLLDSRFDLATPHIEFIDAAQARLILAGDAGASEQTLQWARDHRYVVSVDGRTTPLATAAPDTLASFLGR
ncbi:MAG TPA: RiPP maturation radical SAM C-methyltransferase [Luteitalea sp.]|nr:RiPP maturation radical SAM C-methyltransferase [Luteitalea sp.]